MVEGQSFALSSILLQVEKEYKDMNNDVYLVTMIKKTVIYSLGSVLLTFVAGFLYHAW